MSSTTVSAELIIELTQVLHREAQLLDDGRYEDWLALLDPQVRYAAPVPVDTLGEPSEAEPGGGPRLWLFDDGLGQLELRVAKIRTGLPQTENPASRVVRLIGTVTVDPTGTPDEYLVRSAFILYRHRRQRQVEVIAGHRHDLWRSTSDGWRLASRQIHFAANVLPTKSLSLLY